MSKFALIIKKFGQPISTNYSILIGENSKGEYVATLFDDEFKIVERFVIPSLDALQLEIKNYITSNIGEIVEVSEILNDPLLIAMLKKLKS